jgi:aminoglycoside phosphotransferase (APT) family kinase protein
MTDSNIRYPQVRLQDLFPAPILEATFIDPGHSANSTDVWRVRTAQETAALRISNFTAWNGPFWDGIRWVFGWQPVNERRLIRRNHFLQDKGQLPTPQLLRAGQVDGLGYYVMEWLPGRRCESFSELSPQGLRAYGAHLARLHACTSNRYGMVGGTRAGPVQAFPIHLRRMLERLVETHCRGNIEVAGRLREMQQRASHLQVNSCVPILPDLGASQYLRSEEGELCALVDTDAYVYGPPELDFIILEYEITQAQLDPIVEGYRTISALPRLRDVRPLYRYLYRLMEVEGRIPLKTWMQQPELFP